MDQKYWRVSLTAFKYYSKAIAAYSAENIFFKGIDRSNNSTTHSTTVTIR